PAAALVALTLTAAEEALGARPYALEDVSFSSAVVLASEQRTALQIAFGEEGRDRWSFRWSHREGREWTWAPCASGRLVAETEAAPAVREQLDAIEARCTEALAGGDYYSALASRGLSYGP